MNKIILIIFLMFFGNVFAQTPITDLSTLPIAPQFNCLDCDPTNTDNPKITKILEDSVILNYKSCMSSHKNIFHQDASEETCLRGATIIIGSHNNIAYYFHTGYNNSDKVAVMLLYYSFRPNDFTSCAQMIVCREENNLY